MSIISEQNKNKTGDRRQGGSGGAGQVVIGTWIVKVFDHFPGSSVLPMTIELAGWRDLIGRSTK